jgi:hypothetical protein
MAVGMRRRKNVSKTVSRNGIGMRTESPAKVASAYMDQSKFVLGCRLFAIFDTAGLFLSWSMMERSRGCRQPGE